MKSQYPYLIALFGALPLVFLQGQTSPDRQADFIYKWQGACLEVSPVVPTLVQTAGAPPAFYDYYWEWGDGTFSFEESPSHCYADTSNHEVLLLATGKYDNGKAPKSRKKQTGPSKEKKEGIAMVPAGPTALPHSSAVLGIKGVRNPRPGEEFVGIIGYANQTPIVQSGRLYLFYNQRSYKTTHFQYLESRTHFGEKQLAEGFSSAPPRCNYDGWAGKGDINDWYSVALPKQSPQQALEELQAKYKQVQSWDFNNLRAAEQRHLFVSLASSEQMLADTHAIITLSGLLISDDQRVVEQFDLEMEIVASHDPNYIAVSERRTGFRRIRKKDLVYKIQFQNTGEGPARKVEITTNIPNGLNSSQMQVLDAYPKCLLCPERTVDWSCLDTSFQKDKLVFTFRNIYLPGTRQEGISERDSTKGFVKFRIKPDKNIQKYSLASKAAIVFDKNPPIITNQADTKFKPGVSPGLMLGNSFFPNNDELNNTFVGLSISPFKPFKRFLQWELLLGLGGQSYREQSLRDSSSYFAFVVGPAGTLTELIVDSIVTKVQTIEEKQVQLQLVPLQIRKNWTGWFSTGAGLLLDVSFSKTNASVRGLSEKKVYLCPQEAGLDFPRSECEPLFEFFKQKEIDNSFSDKKTQISASIFADIHLGAVRKGPAMGWRHVLRLSEKPAYYFSLFLYWKI